MRIIIMPCEGGRDNEEMGWFWEGTTHEVEHDRIGKRDHGTGAYYRGFCKSIKWETGM